MAELRIARFVRWKEIHARYSAEVPSFPLPHFSACIQSDTSTNKKES